MGLAVVVVTTLAGPLMRRETYCAIGYSSSMVLLRCQSQSLGFFAFPIFHEIPKPGILAKTLVHSLSDLISLFDRIRRLT